MHYEYLKIFPRTITAIPDDAGGFTGKMIYDLENYGQMLCKNISNVSFHTNVNHTANWRMDVIEDKHKFANYSIFIDALNFYLFEITKFNPRSHWNEITGFDKQYCFERMYFDMGLRKFKRIKDGVEK